MTPDPDSDRVGRGRKKEGPGWSRSPREGADMVAQVAPPTRSSQR